MIETLRPLIALEASGEDREMLAEWLDAAGVDSARGELLKVPGARAAVGSLVRWPCSADVAELPQPVVVLYEAGADLQDAVGVACEILELPDPRDVSSLLSWSNQLNSCLRRVVEHAAANRPAAPAPLEAQAPATARPRERAAPAPAARGRLPELIVVGISTGGPASLREFLAALPNDRRMPPIVIVQHIPAGFVGDLVQRLRVQADYDVRLAADGLRLERGCAYIAPGDRHLRLRADGDAVAAVWSDAPPIRGHKPAVDELFASCAELDVQGIAVIMTGMGRDGAEPMKALRDKGWKTVGQDEATCTIYGMPRAAKECGAVALELPLDRIAPGLVAHSARALTADA